MEKKKKFTRIARITGYLTGDINKKWNPGKRAEYSQRVKHTVK